MTSALLHIMRRIIDNSLYEGYLLNWYDFLADRCDWVMCEADLAPRIAGGGHLEAEGITQSLPTR